MLNNLLCYGTAGCRGPINRNGPEVEKFSRSSRSGRFFSIWLERTGRGGQIYYRTLAGRRGLEDGSVVTKTPSAAPAPQQGSRCGLNLGLGSVVDAHVLCCLVGPVTGATSPARTAARTSTIPSRTRKFAAFGNQLRDFVEIRVCADPADMERGERLSASARYGRQPSAGGPSNT